MKRMKRTALVACLFLAIGCSSRELLDERYGDLGLAANQLNAMLDVKYEGMPPLSLSSEEIRQALLPNFKSLYGKLSGYNISIVRSESGFGIAIRDGDSLIMIDCASTNDSTDYWFYGENPPTVPDNPCR